MLLKETRSNTVNQLSLQQEKFEVLKVEILREHEHTEGLQMQLIERLKGGLVGSVGKMKGLESENEEMKGRIKVLEERLKVNGIEI